MEVILKQDIEKIGKAGSLIKVKDGFARNYLFPNNLAVPGTRANLVKLEAQKQSNNEKLEKAKKQAEELKSKLANLSLTMSVLIQEENKIYGSISSQDIAAALKDEGFEIEKSAIILQEPLKALGIYEVPVKLHPEITANIKVWIVKK